MLKLELEVFEKQERPNDLWLIAHIGDLCLNNCICLFY